MHQLDPDIRHAVLGNAGTIISFRVGAEDAPYLARGFAGQFNETDLVQLPNYRIYLKLMIDGSPSRPFSARTLNMNEPVKATARKAKENALAAILTTHEATRSVPSKPIDPPAVSRPEPIDGVLK
jgi:hypothetical protein